MKKCFSEILLLLLSLFILPLAGYAADSIPRAVLDASDSVVRIVTENSETITSGSGFVIKNDGSGTYIATNYHVVKDSPGQIYVFVSSENSVSASIVTYSEQSDIAVLELSYPVNLPILTLKSGIASRGDDVYAIGFPAAADSLSDTVAAGSDAATITSGIISAVRQLTLEDYGNPVPLLQIDAAVNSGNSGGPLLNSDGTVIGINTYSAYDSQGIYGAIEISELLNVLNQAGISLPAAADFPSVWSIAAGAGVLVLIILALILVRLRRKSGKVRKNGGIRGALKKPVSLRKAVSRAGQPLSVQHAVSLLMPVAVQLRDLHKNGAAHLGVSPDSIFCKNGKASLDKKAENRLTSGFSAPELYRGRNSGAATDLYSFCAVLLYAVTGAEPMNALDRADGAPLLPDAQRPLLASLDCELVALLQKGMAMMPSERCGSMDELISALTPYNAAIKFPSLDAVGASAPAAFAEPTEAAPSQTVPESAPEKRSKKRKPWAAAVIVAASVAAAAGLYCAYGLYTWDKAVAAVNVVDFAAADRYYRASGPFAVWNDREAEGGLLKPYIDAGLLYEDGQYENAAEAFVSLGDFARSQEMDVNSVCAYASQLADAGQFDNALIYLSTSGIGTSNDELFETQNSIKYRLALYDIDNKKYIFAYNLLSGLSDYSDSKALLEKLKGIIYNDAVEKYHAGQYDDDLKKEFDTISDYSNSAAYCTLVSAHIHPGIINRHYTELFALIGFEDANELILLNSAATNIFLVGSWKTASGSTYFNMDSEYSTNCNFPNYPSGEHYYFSDGIYSVGSYAFNATQYLRFTILDKDTISVYCYRNGQTYTMYRQ